jgi:branched-chain amino acid transport system ATP-binding protein
MILLDEPSMGLAPQVVEEIFEIVKDLNAKEGVSFLLAEQNTNQALKYATYGYIMETGRVVMDGEAKSLRENEDVKEFYLGVGEGTRKSFRDVKSYKRRKRWLACRSRQLSIPDVPSLSRDRPQRCSQAPTVPGSACPSFSTRP